MKNGAPARSLAAAGSAASTGSTSKKRPNTAFMARSALAIPPLVRRNSGGEAEPGSQRAGVREDALLDLALRGRLRQRRELLVGHEPLGSGISVRSPRRMPGAIRKAKRFSAIIVDFFR